MGEGWVGVDSPERLGGPQEPPPLNPSQSRGGKRALKPSKPPHILPQRRQRSLAEIELEHAVPQDQLELLRHRPEVRRRRPQQPRQRRIVPPDRAEKVR